MNNKQELYKLFLANLTEKKIKTIMKCIETYLDKSVLQNYESKYDTFVYIYNIEHDKI